MGARLASRTAVSLFGEEGDVVVDPRAQAVILASTVLITESIVLSPLIAELAGVFAVSEAEAGLLMLVYTVPLVVITPPIGALADRVDRRVVFVAGLLIFGLAGAAIALVDTFVAALALRALQAVGYAASGPIAVALLGDLFEGSRETTAQGLRTASINIAIIGVPILSGLLFAFSWRYPFAIYLLAVPVAAWAWLVLPSMGAEDSRSGRRYLRELSALLREPGMPGLLLSFVARYTLLFGVLTYVSVLAINDVGLSVAAAGVAVALKGVVSLGAATQAGRLATRTEPGRLLLGGLTAAGAGMVVMGAVPTVPGLVVGMALYATGDGIVSPSQKSLLNRRTTPELRGGAVAVATTLQNLGKVIGPGLLGGLLLVTGSAEAFVVVGLLGALVLPVARLVGTGISR